MDPLGVPTQINLADGASLPPEVLQSIQEEIRRMSATSGIKVKELQIVVQTSDSTQPSNPETSDTPKTDIPHETFTLKVHKTAGKVEVQKLPHNTTDTAVEISDSEDENPALIVDEERNGQILDPDPEPEDCNSPFAGPEASIIAAVARDAGESLLKMDVEDISEVNEDDPQKQKRGRPPQTSSPGKISTVKAGRRSMTPHKTDEMPSEEMVGGDHCNQRPKRRCVTPRRFEDCVESKTKKIRSTKKNRDANNLNKIRSVEKKRDANSPASESRDCVQGDTQDSEVGRARKFVDIKLRNYGKVGTSRKKQQVNPVENDGGTFEEPTKPPLKKKRGPKPRLRLDSQKEKLDSRSSTQTSSEDETKLINDPDESGQGSESEVEHLQESDEDIERLDSEVETDPATQMKHHRKTSVNSKKSNAKKLGKPHEQKAKCFECNECKRAFTCQRFLDRHTCGKPFICEDCDKSFRARYMLQRHINHVHYHIPQKQPKLKPCKCEICGRVLRSRASLETHMKIHKNIRPHVCEHCSKGFIQKNNLLLHISSVHEMQKPFLCPTCGDSFAQQGGLDYHMRSHMYVRRLQECAEIGFGLDTRVHGFASLQRDDVKCLCCDEMFSNLVRYLHHIKEHVDSTPAEEHKPEILEKIHQILDRNKDILESAKIFRCDECSKIFMTHSELRDHTKAHTAVLGYAFECKYCDKRFGSRSGLQYHQRTHTDVYEYLCGHCNKGFASMSYLMRHCETYHVDGANPKINHPRFKKVTDPDRFKCSVCEKVFGSHYNLKVHQRTHSKVKPYTCPVCSKNFTDPSNMIAHGKRHHPEYPKDTFGSSIKRAKLKEYLAKQEKFNESPELGNPQGQLETVEQTYEVSEGMDTEGPSFEFVHAEIRKPGAIVVVQDQS